MKKLLTIVTSMFALAALVGCGNNPKEPAKEGYSKEDMAIFEEYLVYDLPFYEKASTVSFDENFYTVTLTGKTVATEENIAEFAQLFSGGKNRYTDVDRSLQSYRGVYSDVGYAYDFSEDFSIIELEKTYMYLGQETALVQIVAIGASAADNTLVCSASVYYSYMGEYGSGMWIFTNEYDDKIGSTMLTAIQKDLDSLFVEFYSTEIISEGTEDEQVISDYEEGSLIFVDGEYVPKFGILEFTYVFPWLNGNINSDDFSPMYSIQYMDVDEDLYNDYIDGLLLKDYVLDETSTQDGLYTYIKTCEKGTCVIDITDYDSEYYEYDHGLFYSGFEVTYSYEA